MAPNPQTVITDRELPPEISSRPLSGDEIVISGISGLFPKSDNALELMENLYNKVDMVKEVKCYAHKHPGLPKHIGKMNNTQKFDAQFFRVTPNQANSLDCLTRKAMENAFGAIYDSGINPLTLSGSKLSVFVGSNYYDIMTLNVMLCSKINNFAISGASKAMQANRISYWIDAKGQSVGVDEGCVSSMACLEMAYNSIKRGDSDAALVGGCNTCLHPVLSINLKNAGHLCMDGKTKCFDKNGDGYVRSEAVSLLFLQKAKDAKRIYTEIRHIKGKFFTRPDANFLPIRNTEDMEEFLEEFYSEVKVSPSEVEYVEAFGTGMAEADGNELDAIGRFFAKSKSIKVGSIKSNLGNTEGASGAVAVSKICLAYQKGELPANLHYNEPQDHIPTIRNGRVQVLTQNTPFNRGYTAINSYSFSGSNYHVLLNGIYKNKDPNRYRSYIPRIILLSGRDEQGINKALDALISQPIDAEQIALLHNIYKDNFPGHTGRSYIVLDTNEKKETVCLARSFGFYSGTTRPVCFLYSGMGSQWCGMGADLMRIPVFSAAIERCCKVLSPLGVDIVKILTDTDKTIFDNILNSMVGICAVQIGLTDVLKAMEIVPNNIIGHSIGELGCAYADGCFTAEETILSAYYRGLVSLQTPFIRGSMAAIGLGYKDVLPFCPPEIYVGCHNSDSSSTISGPADDIKHFISALTSRGIFAREVACSNIAFHSKHIAKAGPGLLSHMQNVIKEQKLRSDKWISTSIPQENWDQERAKYASPEYFTNNLLSPVYFEENAALIPNDAVIVEIAPHGLLQAILKRSHKDCINLPITKRGCSDPVIFLLEAVGTLYLNGANPQVQAIYPKVEFPVSIETPLLSHLVEWEHSADWDAPGVTLDDPIETSTRNVFVCVHDDEYKFVADHVRNGVTEVPESALLVFVWETFGMYRGKYYQDMSVTFTDVTFHRQLKIDAEDVLKLRILIQKGNNKFEVMYGNIQIVTGVIIDVTVTNDVLERSETEDIDITYTEEDVYTLLSMKGYSFGGSCRSIHSLNMKRNEAYVKWTGEWTTFLDSLIQLDLFARNHDGVSIPKIIEKLSIQVNKHRNEDTTVIDGVTSYKAEMFKLNAAIRCGGVTLKGVIFEDKPKLEQQPDVLLARKFIPHVLQENLDFNTAITVNLQVVADNVVDDKINILELSSSQSISNVIKEISEAIPTNDFEINWVDLAKDHINIKDIAETNLYVVQNLLGDQNALSILYRVLKEDAFVLTLEQNTAKIGLKNIDLKIITTIQTEKGILMLLKKGDKQQIENATYIKIKYDSTYSWLPRVQSELQQSPHVVLISEKQPYYGLLGLVNSLRKVKGNKISVVIVDDLNAPSFSTDNVIFKEQLQKKLTFNILQKGQWGSYYNLPNSKSANMKNVSLTSDTFKDLDNFTWVETPVSSSENLIKVSYAGLSARDCQKAVSDFKDNDLSFGMDFSGCDSNGKKLMGLVAAGALSSTVETDSALVWPVPQQWNLEDAATVPLPYAHAYYCLAMKVQLLRNQTVFVIGGCGALGQALIALCLSLDCTVFATVGDEKKKRFLLKLFPTLKEENIVCTYDELFYARMIDITQNIRCHYVVNCSSGLLREAAMKCVGFMCTFLDVSDVDMNKNQNFGMSFMVGCKSYISVNLSSVFRPENYVQRKELQNMVAEGIAKGIVRPLSRVVYSPSDVSRAFRLVSSSKNRGRALIRMEDSESLNVVPRMNYSQGVHSVVSDKTEVGIKLIDHLIKNGAKKFILNLKKTDHQPNYLNAKIVSWKKKDVAIEIKSENLQTKEGCERLLNAGHKLGLVTGIYIAIDNKEEINSGNIGCNDLKTSFDKTAVIAANLDNVSRNICKELRNFVIISTSSQSVGSEHAFSACENICEARKKIGLPALMLRSLVLKETNRNKLFSLSSLFSAMDIGLKLKYDNILALNLPSTSDFNEKIEKILGVENINVVDERLSLDNLNLIDETIEKISSELSLNNQSIDDLRKMPLSSLRNVYNKSKRQNKNSNDGLRPFYNNIEKNETVAFDTFTSAKTLLPAPEAHGYTDRCTPHLMMIPGFEGHHQIFTSLAERLKIRAATLNLGPDMICDSIPEMAKILANYMKTHYEIHSKFYILGYSFGVNVALEVAKLLEAEGRTGVVYCLDSSPDALRLQLNGFAENIAEDKLQNILLEHMCRLITGQEEMKLQQDLETIDSWSEKIEVCMKQLHGLVHYSNEHTRTVLNSAYKRITLARKYEPEIKLESELVLIRGVPDPKVNSLDEDYNLSKYTKRPVTVFHIESDHVSAPYDCRVPNFINKMFDPQLLEEFKKKNLCHFYYCK